MKHPIDLGRPMSDAEDKAFSYYLTSLGIRSRALDAAQHAIARMRPGDVQADFVMWLSEGRLWVDSSGQVTPRPGRSPQRVRL